MKLRNLKLKTRPKQLLGSLPLVIALPITTLNTGDLAYNGIAYNMKNTTLHLCFLYTVISKIITFMFLCIVISKVITFVFLYTVITFIIFMYCFK